MGSHGFDLWAGVCVAGEGGVPDGPQTADALLLRFTERTQPPDSAALRAERRRATWTGGVAGSFAELDELDLQGWLAVSPADRVLAIWPLTLDAMRLAGDDGPPPRLQRSAGGVRSR